MKARRLGMIVALLVVSASIVPAGAQPLSEPILEIKASAGSAEGQLHVNPNFDILPAYAFAEADNYATHALHGAMYPGFLIDAFFYLYGAQTIERTLLGIAETLWPQGPGDRDATISDPVLRNAGDPRAFPARAGHATAFSKRLKTGGAVLLAALDLPNVAVGELSSSTQLDGTSGPSRADAEQVASDVRIAGGAVRIERVRGTARAVSSGDPATSSATSELLVAGATVNGVPVRITPEGVQGPTRQATDAANQFLASIGVHITLLPASKGVTGSRGNVTAQSSTGGVVVSFARDFTPPDQVRSYNEQFCAALSQVPTAAGTCVHTDRESAVALVLGNAHAFGRYVTPTTLLAGGASLSGPGSVQTITERTGVLPGTLHPIDAASPGASLVEQIDAAPVVQRRTTTTFLPFGGGAAGGLKAAYVALLTVAVLVAAGRRLIRSLSTP